MNKLAEILKRHIWCVIIIAVIILLSLITLSFGEDVDLVSHLSLASAIVSIVLAVIVIIYTFFLNQRSSQNIAEMKKLIDEGYRTMTDKAGLMADKAQSLEQMMAGTFQPPTDSNTTSTPLEIKEPLQLDVSVYSAGGLSVLYSVAKSYETSKPMSWEVISGLIEEKEGREGILCTFGLGIIQSIQAFLGKDCVTSSTKQQEVKKLPDGFKKLMDDEINNRLEQLKNDDADDKKWMYAYFKKSLSIIDDYFDKL